MVDKQKGMTEKEINKKLKSLKRNEWRATYLLDLEPRIKMTDPSTQKAYYKVLGDLLSNPKFYIHGFNPRKKIVECYKKAGLKDKAKELQLDLVEDNFSSKLSQGYVHTAHNGRIEIIDDIQSEEDVQKFEKNYLDAGLTELETYSTMAKQLQKHRRFGLAAIYYKKAGMDSNANEMLQKKDSPSLEQIAASLGIMFGITSFFLVSLIFFLSSNMTGNTILNSSFKFSNFIGVGLFILGVVLSFLYVRKNKKVEVKRKVVKKKVKSKAKKKKSKK